MKILYTASVLSHICQFHLSMMKMLHENGWEIHVAAEDNLAEKDELKLRHCDRYINLPFRRSPSDGKNLDAYRQLKALLKEVFYDVIVCNTPVCGVLTRLAARETRRRGTRIVYFAHGFHFYSGAPKKLWLLYPLEKFFANRYTDLLIVINKEDYERAAKHFKCRVERVPGVGVDAGRYHPVSPEERNRMRAAVGLNKEDFAVICTGELLPNKNQRTLIEAVHLCRDKIPNIRLLLAGNGREQGNLENQIRRLNLQNHVKLLGYRSDLETIVPCVDVVSSASIREGLGLNVIEGMLCAKPVVASKNRGHCELVVDGRTGFLVDHDSAPAFADRFFELYAKRGDTTLGANGYQRAQTYSSAHVVEIFSGFMDALCAKQQ